MAKESKRRGGPHSAPTAWASFGGDHQFRYGIPDNDGAMRFRFYPDDPHHEALMGSRLTERIALDRTRAGSASRPRTAVGVWRAIEPTQTLSPVRVSPCCG
jgi:hypothetical protein